MIPSYLSPLANHLWQSTVFAGIAALLTLALRKHRASARYWLWFAASVKFLVPFSVVVSFGSHIHWRNSSAATPTQRSAAFEQVIQPFVIHHPGSLLASVPEVSSRIPTVLLSIWTCGFLFSIACWLRAWLGFRTAVRRASPLKLDLDRSRDSIPAMSTTLLLEPCVFGLLRPVLLLPEGIHNRLSPEEFDSVVAHELCHVRRRDNLTGALHMFVEAVFWFYPLLWWVGKHLLEDREHACDEEVLRAGGNPEVYANGIVNVTRFCVESQLECAPGIGSNLKRRVETIMTGHPSRQLSIGRKLLLFAAGAVAVVVPITIGVFNAPASNAQSTTDTQPRFEVASIKPDVSGQPGPQYRIFPGFTVQRATLKDLVMTAYQIGDFRVSGGPGWINSDRYNIEAKAEAPPAFSQEYRMLQYRRLQTLLQERFKLAVHRETKEVPVYDLTIVKGGPKLHPPSCIQREPGNQTLTIAPGKTAMDYCGFSGWSGRGRYQASTGSIAELAGALSFSLGRMVIDKTGIAGRFRIELTFTSAATIPPTGAGAPDAPAGAALADLGPDIFTALQEQLGLKLESSKSPVDVLLIDHVERPSEN